MKKMGAKNADSINARPAAICFGPEQLDQISMFELQFSTTKFLPQYHMIPNQFKFGHTKWNRLLSDWFYSGVTDLQLVPKRGVDVKKALRVIKAHMISFEPSHGHKEAGVAYMMSVLFEDAEWSLDSADRMDAIGERK
jgi:hypothetical protein